MNKTQTGLGVFLFLCCMGGGLALGVQAMAESGKDHASDQHKKSEKRSIAVIQNELYNKECGSCHFPYQPGWLPSRSWDKIMSGLHDHFGENAELTPEPQRQLTEWLRANAAERANGGKSHKMLHSIKETATPLRITEIDHFQQEHRKLPPRAWKENPGVRSMSRCESCHPRAAEGAFNEHEVRIPGMGSWQD